MLWVADSSFAKDLSRFSLPESATARLGKGRLRGAIMYSPDGRRLAVDSSIGVWMYDIQNGEALYLLPGSQQRRFIFSPDGETFAILGAFNIYLYDVETGTHIRTLAERMDYMPYDLAFSPDGNILVTSSWDDIVYLWDVETGEHIRTLTGDVPFSSVQNIIFSPDGKTIATGSGDTSVHLWDVETGNHIIQIRTGYTGWGVDIAFSPDGNTLATESSGTGGSHASVDLWDVETGEHIRTLTLTGHTDDAFTVVFRPDSKTIASLGSKDGTVMLWDVETGEHIRTLTLTGHTEGFSTRALSPDGKTIVSASEDGTVMLWDVETSSLIRTLTGHGGDRSPILSVSFSPDGKIVASGSQDGTVMLSDVETATEIRTLTLTGHTDWAGSIAFSADGTTLASVGRGADKTIKLWEVGTGIHIRTLNQPTLYEVSSVVFSADGTTLASGTTSGKILLWEVGTGTEIRTFTGHTDWVTKVVFSADGTTLASASGGEDDPIRLWDVETGTEIRTLTGHTEAPLSVAFSPDGTILVGAIYGHDGTIMLWDVRTGAHIRTLTGHTLWVRSVAFSPDGTTLATGSVDGTVLLWDMSPTPPETEARKEDVNADGHVNIQDLVLVASHLGTSGQSAADVNNDGHVNVQDLVLVASALGTNGSAPSLQHQQLNMFTATEVEKWITDAQRVDLTDAKFLRGILFLQHLLAALTPEKTTLLANYPNPFNPETWIPYQLAKPSEVTLRIHAVDGSLVRTLLLGHKTIGVYQNRSRAAYWNGRNAQGESVASGIYFYTLTAGDFTATRKMLIRK